ncbi:MAG: hypothetical protein B6245_09850 [Desulfobacteraceae bacterium 4572_88]|nr:MAG: hypothetical protein B6245_09850 [Desulfobacteraceae bacterium 4572_88]
MRYGRASLTSDLLGDLRSQMTDRLVLYLISPGGEALPVCLGGGQGMRMDEKAIRAYLTNYEKFMTASFTDKRSREQKNYRKVIRENIARTEQVLMENTDYRPYIFYS